MFFDSSALLHSAWKLNENIFFIVVTKMFTFSTRICEIQLYITKWLSHIYKVFVFLLVRAQIWVFGSFF